MIIDNMGHLYDMNDRQYVITDIQEHLYVRKSEYVLKLLLLLLLFFFSSLKNYSYYIFLVLK